MSRTTDSIFRPFVPSDAERSDRSAGDRARHRLKLRESIRDNIADIIAEESIIGKDRGKIIKVPIRGIREFRFVYGENAPGVGQAGSLVAGALEQSNVEMTSELVSLMTSQRNYQANTKVFQTQNQIMQSLMQAV